MERLKAVDGSSHVFMNSINSISVSLQFQLPFLKKVYYHYVRLGWSYHNLDTVRFSPCHLPGKHDAIR